MELMAHPFPAPPPPLESALALLANVAVGDEQTLAGLGEAVHDLPRPWEPATCPPRLRALIWAWCDDVAAWINAAHRWRPAQVSIPACWPQHPHIVHDLPVLACQRLAASKVFEPAALEEWHRYTLPSFFVRLQECLSESTCRDGVTHQPWPGKARHTNYLSPEVTQVRRRHFQADGTEHPTTGAVGPHAASGIRVLGADGLTNGRPHPRWMPE